MQPGDIAELLAKQKNLCQGCGQPFNDDYVIDHDHETKEVRGLLCQGCNKGMGFADDNPAMMRRWARYVEGVELEPLTVPFRKSRVEKSISDIDVPQLSFERKLLQITALASGDSGAGGGGDGGDNRDGPNDRWTLAEPPETMGQLLPLSLLRDEPALLRLCCGLYDSAQLSENRKMGISDETAITHGQPLFNVVVEKRDGALRAILVRLPIWFEVLNDQSETVEKCRIVDGKVVERLPVKRK